MEILRQSGIYSLVYNPENESESLIYYIDNGEDVSEYFDEIEAEKILSAFDVDFELECAEYF